MSESSPEDPRSKIRMEAIDSWMMKYAAAAKSDPDRRQIVNDLDAEALEQAAAADAGKLQEARRIDGAAADDHFFAGLHLVDGPAAFVDVANRHGFRALEHDLEGARMDAKVNSPGLLLRW